MGKGVIMMNPNNIRTLTSVDLINKLGRTDLIPIQIERDFYKKLRTNLIIKHILCV